MCVCVSVCPHVLCLVKRRNGYVYTKGIAGPQGEEGKNVLVRRDHLAENAGGVPMVAP